MWNIDNICRVLDENPQKSIVFVSYQKNLVHHKIHTSPETSNRNCRSVLHELTPNRLPERRLHICLQLIVNPMDNIFIRRIVTFDVKLVYYRNLTPRNSGSVPFNLPKSSLKKSVWPRSNLMLCVWWNLKV